MLVLDGDGTWRSKRSSFQVARRTSPLSTPSFRPTSVGMVMLCTVVGVFAWPLALLGLQYTRGGTTLFLDICTRNALAKTVCLMICYHGYCIESFVDVSRFLPELTIFRPILHAFFVSHIR